MKNTNIGGLRTAFIFLYLCFRKVNNRLIGQKPLVKSAVCIDFSIRTALFSCFNRFSGGQNELVKTPISIEISM